MKDKKIPLIIIAGPTGVGKSAIAVELALKTKGEVISADSMQVYRHMDIGSAKITEAEKRGVPHHLIDVYEPWESFDVVRFKNMSKAAIVDINSRNRLPIIAGGTGFYIQALLYDIDFDEGSSDSGSPNNGDNSLRQELEQLAELNGREFLHNMLKEVDPEAADSIHPNNIKRVIRAIEFNRITGNKISSHNESQRKRPAAYDFLYFGITDDRDLVYSNIEKRVDIMIENGLVDEVKQLIDMGITGDLVSMQGLGYKEIYDYLTGKTDFERAVYLIKRDTRHFAKRQLTWLRREKDVIWINKKDFKRDNSLIAEHMISMINNKIQVS